MDRKISRLRAVLLLLLSAITAIASAPANSSELPIRRVILYKHGVGYFERIGSAEGEAVYSLRFKAKDMSDLLKSLTVLDLGGGSIRTVAYDSTKTVDQQLGEYTFDLRSAQGFPGILDQMKGSEIALTVGQAQLAGRLLSVEKRTERAEGGGTIERYRISVLLPDGKVKNYDLSDVSQLQFTNPGLQKEMEKYLDILFSRHRRDEKQVQILASGKGKRDLFVSYVQEQPVWKVSYRIVTGKKEKPLLQAWAIVDNVSTEDWNNVELSLVSGLPVSFVQNLYDPIFVRRREIQVEREASVGPVTAEARRAEPEMRLAKEKAMMRQDVVRKEEARAMAAPRPDVYGGISREPAQAVGQEAGALFVYHIKEPVTIKRDRSALLPIVNARLDGQRVALYNESIRRDNPLDTIRIRNTTSLTLEGGPITVIEDNTYAGEALMSTVKPKEERYISFAVDLGVRADGQRRSGAEEVYKVTIANGMMMRHIKLREMKVYTFENIEDKAKTVIIEHPRRPGEWKVVETPPPREETPGYYRFEMTLGSKGEKPEKKEFKVVEEMTKRTEYRLAEGIEANEIRFFLQQRLIDEKTRAFLEQILGLRSQIAEFQRKMKDLQNEEQTIFSDQTRLRSNLQSLGQSEEERNLRSRIVRQLNEQEDKLGAITKSVRDLRTQVSVKQTELNKVVMSYSFETPSK